MCDALVRIDGKAIANYVDGPSAGAAMAVAAYAAINGMGLRDDAVITGSVDVFGNVGMVGGLFEKAKAVIADGKKYFVTPVNRISEKVMLRQLKEGYNLTIIEISDSRQAVDFFVYGKEIAPVSIQAMKRGVPNVTAYEPEGLGSFATIARKMIETENASVESLPENSGDDREIKEYFRGEVERQVGLLGLGYLFTAANEAFLNYIDVETIANADAGTLDLVKKRDAVNACLGELGKNIPKKATKTTSNFEYAIGSELREKWAKKKMAGITINDSQLVEERYYLFNELMYADAWCRVATELADSAIEATAPSEAGSDFPLNESGWKPLAEMKIKEAEALEISADEWNDHLENAKELFDEGKYGAASYEATFAAEMHEADLLSQNPDFLRGEVETLASGKRSSLWGRIYQTQGVFLSRGTEAEKKSAYGILLYARALDNLTAEMYKIKLDGYLETVAGSADGFAISESPPPSDEDLAAMSVAVGSVVAALSYLIFKKAEREKQEKSGGKHPAEKRKERKENPGKIKGRLKIHKSRKIVSI